MNKIAFSDEDNYKWWVLFTVSLGAVTVSLDSSILIVCLPTLARIFRTDSSVIGWVNIAYLTMSQSLGLILARIGDARGRKMVYMTGLAFYTAGLVACASAQGPYQLILARALQGIGAATGWSLTMALVVAVFPGVERGKALGTLAGAYSIGLVAGPILGGFLLDGLGWRAVFYMRIPLALGALILARYVIREQRQDDGNFRFDFGGSISLFGCLSALMLFFSFSGKWGFGNFSALTSGICAVALLGLFLFVEFRTAQPIINPRLFGRRLFAAAVVAGGFQAAAGMTALFLIPFYLSGTLGYSGSATGIFMAVLAVPVLIFSPIAGRLSDKIGAHLLAGSGMVLFLIGVISLANFGEDPNFFVMVGTIALIGVSMGIFQPPNNSDAIGSAPKGMLGTASAIVSTVRNIGSAGSVAATSAVFSVHEARYFRRFYAVLADAAEAKKAAVAAGFHDTLMIAVVVALIALGASLIRGSRPKAPSRKGSRQEPQG